MSSALKQLLNQPPSARDVATLVNNLETDSERSAAIVAAAILDDILRKTISKKLVKLTKSESDKLFRGTGPLASFSTKIHMGYALGVYGRKTRHDLVALNSVRNLFAHGLLIVTFDTEEVARTLSGFHCLADLKESEDLNPQQLFASITRILITHLIRLTQPRFHVQLRIESLD